MSLIEGIGAVGEGLSREIPALLTAARDQRAENERQRALNSPVNQYQQAVSAQALEELKKNQTKYSLDDLAKTNPYAPFMIQEAKNDMTIMPGQTHISLGEAKEKMKAYLSDENKMIPWTQKLMEQKSQEVKAAETSLNFEKSKLEKLQQDPLGNKEKIAEIQDKIQQYTQVLGQSKQQESGLSEQMDKLELMKAQKYRATLKGEPAEIFDAVLEDNKKSGKTGKALIPTANQMLAKKQETKYQDKPSDWKVFVAEKPEMASKWGTKEGGDAFAVWRKQQLKAKQESATANLDIPDLAQSLKQGEVSLSMIKNTRGAAVSNMVMSEVRKEYPHYNFIYQEANAKYITSTVNQRILGAVDASLPRVNMLAEQAEKLGNTDFPAWNAILKQISVQTGDPTYTNFMSNRNAIVQEVNTALSGSSQSSDMRVQIELENLKEARSPKQLAGAIMNLREALLARRDASLTGKYPLEVVIGEKTIEQYTKEMNAKYRGKYGSPQSSGTGTQESGNPFDSPSGKVTSQAGNMQLAEVKPEDVPLGTGYVNQTKSIIELQKQASDALQKEDYSKYEELNKQIQELVNQRKNMG